MPPAFDGVATWLHAAIVGAILVLTALPALLARGARMATLPFALLHRVPNASLIPLITMMVAYPLVSLDQIGIELQNPFSAVRLSHLPLDVIAATIEGNVTGLARAAPRQASDAQPVLSQLLSESVALSRAPS